MAVKTVDAGHSRLNFHTVYHYVCTDSLKSLRNQIIIPCRNTAGQNHGDGAGEDLFRPVEEARAVFGEDGKLVPDQTLCELLCEGIPGVAEGDQTAGEPREVLLRPPGDEGDQIPGGAAVKEGTSGGGPRFVGGLPALVKSPGGHGIPGVEAFQKLPDSGPADGPTAPAVPEEIAKLTMLWLFLRKNPYYDEYFDGIVYAACVGLGFAGAENILYLLQSEDWMVTGIMRGLSAVPAHFSMACAMGYFYSKRHFGDRSPLTMVCILAVPIIFHWVWDALAFSEVVNPAWSVPISILFVALIFYLYKSTMRRINALQKRDKARMTPPPFPGEHPSSGNAPLPPPLQ